MKERRVLVLVFACEQDLTLWTKQHKPLLAEHGEPTPDATAVVSDSDGAWAYLVEQGLGA